MSKTILLFSLICITVIYSITMSPTITWIYPDSAELVLAAAEPGIAHPPGYPTYILVSFMWHTFLPISDIAYTQNLFSLFCVLLSLIVFTKLLDKINEQTTLIARIAFCGGMLMYALAPLTWSLATNTEVYAMGALCFSLLLLLIWNILQAVKRWQIYGVGLILGLSYGVMPMLVIFTIPVVILILNMQRTFSLLYDIIVIAIGIILGLSVFIYLPIQAAMEPQMNWGNPNTWSNFWSMVSGKQYQHLVGISNLQVAIERFLEGLFQLIKNIQFWGLIPAIIGFRWLNREYRAYNLFLTSILFMVLGFFIFYYVDGAHVYLLPAIIVLSIYVGLGFRQMLEQQPNNASLLILFVTVSLLVAHIIVWYPRLDRSQDFHALNFANSVVHQVPNQAVILTHTDETTFALWYGIKILNRDDVVIIDTRLIHYDWYRQNLLKQHSYIEEQWLRLGGFTGLENPLFEINGVHPDYTLKSLN